MSIIAEDRRQMRSGNWFISTRQKAETSMSADGYANGKQAGSWGSERLRNWKH